VTGTNSPVKALIFCYNCLFYIMYLMRHLENRLISPLKLCPENIFQWKLVMVLGRKKG